MKFWNGTSPPWWWDIPTAVPEYDTEALLTVVKDPVLEKITFALRVFLFITCLVENSIAVYILHKSVRNEERKTFAQHMLISISCADILTALVSYPAMFVEFSHGGLVWFGGPIGDFLCKLYNFLVNLPGKVVSLSLIGLACDAMRNSSSKGRKEHTKKFSIVVTTLLWLAASGLSAVYLALSKVQRGSQFNECKPTETYTQSMAVFMLQLLFTVSSSIILAILDIVALIRVKRRGREMKERKGRESEMARPHSKKERHREITHQTDREMQPTTSHESCTEDRVIENSHPPEPQFMGSEILSEMASAGKETENTPGNTEASVTDSKMSAVDKASKTHEKQNEQRKVKSESGAKDVERAGDSENVTGQSAEDERFETKQNEAEIICEVAYAKSSAVKGVSKSHAKQKEERKVESENGPNDVEAGDSEHVTGQSAEDERLQTTRTEVKIMIILSIPFIILSIIMLILPFVCLTCSIYALYAVLMAVEIFAVIKPAIYDKTDKEFRKRYRQLSPFACCCFRRFALCSE